MSDITIAFVCYYSYMDAKTMSEIIRVERATHPFTVMDNSPINDKGLSFDSLGVLVYLLSKPDNWQVKTKELQKRGGCGQSKMLRILKELEEEGYLARNKKPGKAGRFIWDIVIYENKYANPIFAPTMEPPEKLPTKQEPPKDLSLSHIDTPLKATMSRYLASEGIPIPDNEADWDLITHIAAASWITITKSFPGYNKLQFLVDRIGDKPDTVAIANAYVFWINSGYNPNNLTGMMEWYELIKADPAWTPGAKYNKGKNNAGHSRNSGKFSKADRATQEGPTEEHEKWLAAERVRQAGAPA